MSGYPIFPKLFVWLSFLYWVFLAPKQWFFKGFLRVQERKPDKKRCDIALSEDIKDSTFSPKPIPPNNCILVFDLLKKILLFCDFFSFLDSFLSIFPHSHQWAQILRINGAAHTFINLVCSWTHMNRTPSFVQENYKTICRKIEVLSACLK